MNSHQKTIAIIPLFLLELLYIGYDIDIIASMAPNDVDLEDTRGFNSLDGSSVFPHYTNYKSKLTEEENRNRLDKFTNSKIDFTKSIGAVIAIPKEDAIYLNGDKIEVLGTRPYYIFENGISKKFEVEDKYIRRI